MAYIEGVQPGQQVTVKIVQRPTNAAAQKTLMRLLTKDPDIQREVERHRKVRRSNLSTKIRGGRVWYQRLVKQAPTTLEVGRTGTLQASVDVLQDLGSVRRFVEVEPA